jgi:hypothetical protein
MCEASSDAVGASLNLVVAELGVSGVVDLARLFGFSA